MSASSNRALELAAALAALATAAAVHGQPKVYYVDASNTGAHNGASWGTAYRDLQDALTAARNDQDRAFRGVEIRIAQGIYTPDRATGDRTQAFVLNSAVTLLGGFAGLPGANPDARDPNRFVSVLSGDLGHNDGPNFTNYEDNSSSIVSGCCTDGTEALDGLTISGANAGGGYGSAFSSNRTLSVRRCIIKDNMAVAGASIIRTSGGTWSACRIENNLVRDGTLLVVAPGTFQGVRIRGNRVARTVTGPSVSGSLLSVTGYYGYPTSGSFRMLSCLVADNLSDGYGLLTPISSPAVDLEYCTIVNNTAALGPIVIPPSYANLVMGSCIVAGNHSTSPGIPDHQIYASSYAAYLTLVRPILIDSGASAIYQPVGPFGSAFILSGSPRFFAPSGPDNNPATWQDNDYRLRPGSPAIDRGNAYDSAFAYAYTDLDGMPLYDDPNTPNLGVGFVTYADLGCYEFQGALCPADFNASGTLSVGDIFDFLNAWLAGDARADFDGGGLAVSDIFAFINAWLAGC